MILLKSLLFKCFKIFIFCQKILINISEQILKGIWMRPDPVTTLLLHRIQFRVRIHHSAPSSLPILKDFLGTFSANLKGEERYIYKFLSWQTFIITKYFFLEIYLLYDITYNEELLS